MDQHRPLKFDLLEVGGLFVILLATGLIGPVANRIDATVAVVIAGIATAAYAAATRWEARRYGPYRPFDPPPEGARLSQRAIALRRRFVRQPWSQMVVLAAVLTQARGAPGLADSPLRALAPLAFSALFALAARAASAGDLRRAGIEP
jgi:hypothetical protein